MDIGIDFNVFRQSLSLMVAAIALLFFGMWFLAAFVRNFMEKIIPPITTDAVVVCKRIEVKTKDSNKKTHTLYHMTFQSVIDGLPQGKRTEFKVSSKVFALTREGDLGVLKIHLSNFKDFTFYDR